MEDLWQGLLDHPQYNRLGMIVVARLAAILMSLMLLGAATVPSRAADFDFYVLSLSWSPSWCAENDRDGSTAQCSGRRAYAFIVHGLWPQGERNWPEYCPSSEPERVPQGLAQSMYDIIPSAGLAGHEWRKHGSCSGLSQRSYFDTLRSAYAKLKMPPVIFDGKIPRRLATDDIESLVVKANPGLTRDAIAVTCDNGQLAEVRICMTKSLAYRSCQQVDRNACRSRMVNLPAIP